jgi:hypothetical protein
MENCGLCGQEVENFAVRQGAKDSEQFGKGLCNSCLDFVVSFSMSSSFEEAEALTKAEPQRFLRLKQKLEVI